MSDQLTFAPEPRTHIAIMKKSWGLLPKILSGEKTIESRWYMHKVAPWGRISTGEAVYFKNSGEPVALKATVGDVVTFAGLKPGQALEILQTFGSADGIGLADIGTFAELFKQKHYCMLIQLADAAPVEPFHIDKTGWGAQAAWLIVPDIDAIRRPVA